MSYRQVLVQIVDAASFQAHTVLWAQAVIPCLIDEHHASFPTIQRRLLCENMIITRLSYEAVVPFRQTREGTSIFMIGDHHLV